MRRTPMIISDCLAILHRTKRVDPMSDLSFPKQGNPLSSKLLAGAWAFSTALAMIGWCAALTWAVVRLVQAVS